MEFIKDMQKITGEARHTADATAEKFRSIRRGLFAVLTLRLPLVPIESLTEAVDRFPNWYLVLQERSIERDVLRNAQRRSTGEEHII